MAIVRSRGAKKVELPSYVCPIYSRVDIVIRSTRRFSIVSLLFSIPAGSKSWLLLMSGCKFAGRFSNFFGQSKKKVTRCAQRFYHIFLSLPKISMEAAFCKES